MNFHRLAAMCVVVAGAAHAQYREGEPPTIALPPVAVLVDEEGSVVRAFRDAYVRAGSPRIVVSWNKPFDDTLADVTIKQRSMRSSSRNQSTKLEDTTQGAAGGAKLTESKGLSESESVIREGSYVANPPVRPGMAEQGSWILETEFNGVLINAGVNLIDRAAIMRTTSIQPVGRNDSRAVETAAFEAKAELLLEILLAEDRRGPSGWLYRVRLLKVKTGERLGEFVTYAAPRRPVEHGQYQATDHGFVKYTPQRAFTLNEVSHQLGLDVLKQLTTRLKPGAGRIAR